MKTHAISLVIAMLLVCIAQAEVRKWTDTTGGYSVQAELVGVKEGKVQLRKADGRVISVALEKLSVADQEYVRQQSGQSSVERKKAPQGADKNAKPVWTMDLAQMGIPDVPARGSVGGQEFTVQEAKMENGILELREGKDFFPDKSLKIFMFLEEGATAEGRKFRISPKQEFGGPQVHVHMQYKPAGDQGFGETEMFIDKFAMILEFGRKQAGKIPGRIYVSLPDKLKSFVAGTFAVVLDDETSEPGTGEIAGRITLKGPAPQGWITVDGVGKNAEGKLEAPGAGIKLDGSCSFGNCMTWKPRNSLVRWDEKTSTGIHKHINRPPGPYLVFARASHDVPTGPEGVSESVFDGYFDAKWVEIKVAGESVTTDLSIEPDALGTLEIAVPGGGNESAVVCVPLDAQGQLPLPETAYYLQGTCSAKPENGKAVVRVLREGKYRVAIGPWQPSTLLPAAAADVDVKRGQTAHVELTPPVPDATPLATAPQVEALSATSDTATTPGRTDALPAGKENLMTRRAALLLDRGRGRRDCCG